MSRDDDIIKRLERIESRLETFIVAWSSFTPNAESLMRQIEEVAEANKRSEEYRASVARLKAAQR